MIKRTHSTWTRDEITLLVQNLNEKPEKLVSLFPNRTYFSVLSKKNKIIKKNLGTDSSQIELDLYSKSVTNESIGDINEVLDQALKKIEELMIENGKLNDKVKELTDELDNQKNEIDEIATTSKSRWALIKKVFS